MGQRYFGYRLGPDEPPDLQWALVSALAGALGLAAALLIAPDTADELTTRSVAALLAAPALTAALFAGHGAWSIARGLRAAEAADSVTPPQGTQEDPPQRSLRFAAATTVGAGAVVAAISLLGWPAAGVALVASLAGRELGRWVAERTIRRLERRQGRRYYRTTGEPEKIVWLTASGLE